MSLLFSATAYQLYERPLVERVGEITNNQLLKGHLPIYEELAPLSKAKIPHEQRLSERFINRTDFDALPHETILAGKIGIVGKMTNIHEKQNALKEWGMSSSSSSSPAGAAAAASNPTSIDGFGVIALQESDRKFRRACVAPRTLAISKNGTLYICDELGDLVLEAFPIREDVAAVKTLLSLKTKALTLKELAIVREHHVKEAALAWGVGGTSQQQQNTTSKIGADIEAMQRIDEQNTVQIPLSGEELIQYQRNNQLQQQQQRQSQSLLSNSMSLASLQNNENNNNPFVAQGGVAENLIDVDLVSSPSPQQQQQQNNNRFLNVNSNTNYAAGGGGNIHHVQSNSHRTISSTSSTPPLGGFQHPSHTLQQQQQNQRGASILQPPPPPTKKMTFISSLIVEMNAVSIVVRHTEQLPTMPPPLTEDGGSLVANASFGGGGALSRSFASASFFKRAVNSASGRAEDFEGIDLTEVKSEDMGSFSALGPQASMSFRKNAKNSNDALSKTFLTNGSMLLSRARANTILGKSFAGIEAMLQQQEREEALRQEQTVTEIELFTVHRFLFASHKEAHNFIAIVKSFAEPAIFEAESLPARENRELLTKLSKQRRDILRKQQRQIEAAKAAAEAKRARKERKRMAILQNSSFNGFSGEAMTDNGSFFDGNGSFAKRSVMSATTTGTASRRNTSHRGGGGGFGDDLRSVASDRTTATNVTQRHHQQQQGISKSPKMSPRDGSLAIVGGGVADDLDLSPTGHLSPSPLSSSPSLSPRATSPVNNNEAKGENENDDDEPEEDPEVKKAREEREEAQIDRMLEEMVGHRIGGFNNNDAPTNTAASSRGGGNNKGGGGAAVTRNNSNNGHLRASNWAGGTPPHAAQNGPKNEVTSSNNNNNKISNASATSPTTSATAGGGVAGVSPTNPQDERAADVEFTDMLRVSQQTEYNRRLNARESSEVMYPNFSLGPHFEHMEWMKIRMREEEAKRIRERKAAVERLAVAEKRHLDQLQSRQLRPVLDSEGNIKLVDDADILKSITQQRQQTAAATPTSPSKRSANSTSPLSSKGAGGGGEGGTRATMDGNALLLLTEGTANRFAMPNLKGDVAEPVATIEADDFEALRWKAQNTIVHNRKLQQQQEMMEIQKQQELDSKSGSKRPLTQAEKIQQQMNELNKKRSKSGGKKDRSQSPTSPTRKAASTASSLIAEADDDDIASKNFSAEVLTGKNNTDAFLDSNTKRIHLGALSASIPTQTAHTVAREATNIGNKISMQAPYPFFGPKYGTLDHQQHKYTVFTNRQEQIEYESFTKPQLNYGLQSFYGDVFEGQRWKDQQKEIEKVAEEIESVKTKEKEALQKRIDEKRQQILDRHLKEEDEKQKAEREREEYLRSQRYFGLASADEILKLQTTHLQRQKDDNGATSSANVPAAASSLNNDGGRATGGLSLGGGLPRAPSTTTLAAAQTTTNSSSNNNSPADKKRKDSTASSRRGGGGGISQSQLLLNNADGGDGSNTDNVANSRRRRMSTQSARSQGGRSDTNVSVFAVSVASTDDTFMFDDDDNIANIDLRTKSNSDRGQQQQHRRRSTNSNNEDEKRERRNLSAAADNDDDLLLYAEKAEEAATEKKKYENSDETRSNRDSNGTAYAAAARRQTLPPQPSQTANANGGTVDDLDLNDDGGGKGSGGNADDLQVDDDDDIDQKTSTTFDDDHYTNDNRDKSKKDKTGAAANRMGNDTSVVISRCGSTLTVTTATTTTKGGDAPTRLDSEALIQNNNGTTNNVNDNNSRLTREGLMNVVNGSPAAAAAAATTLSTTPSRTNPTATGNSATAASASYCPSPVSPRGVTQVWERNVTTRSDFIEGEKVTEKIHQQLANLNNAYRPLTTALQRQHMEKDRLFSYVGKGPAIAAERTEAFTAARLARERVLDDTFDNRIHIAKQIERHFISADQHRHIVMTEEAASAEEKMMSPQLNTGGGRSSAMATAGAISFSSPQPPAAAAHQLNYYHDMNQRLSFSPSSPPPRNASGLSHSNPSYFDPSQRQHNTTTSASLLKTPPDHRNAATVEKMTEHISVRPRWMTENVSFEPIRKPETPPPPTPPPRLPPPILPPPPIPVFVHLTIPTTRRSPSATSPAGGGYYYPTNSAIDHRSRQQQQLQHRDSTIGSVSDHVGRPYHPTTAVPPPSLVSTPSDSSAH